ncbi:MAG: potassium channel family protein [Schaalia turicensis]|nr:potassium channel family protein [Schaalia turicensis]
MNAVWAIFTIDYAVRLVLAPDRRSWFWRHLLDLAAVVLPVLRPLRLLRLVALFGVLQRSAGSALRGRITAYTVASVSLLVFVGAFAILDAEQGVDGASLHSFENALWWTIVTITTVGYGDLSPVTPMDRFVAMPLDRWRRFDRCCDCDARVVGCGSCCGGDCGAGGCDSRTGRRIGVTGQIVLREVSPRCCCRGVEWCSSLHAMASLNCPGFCSASVPKCSQRLNLSRGTLRAHSESPYCAENSWIAFSSPRMSAPSPSETSSISALIFCYFCTFPIEPLPPILNPLSQECRTLAILYPIRAVSFHLLVSNPGTPHCCTQDNLMFATIILYFIQGRVKTVLLRFAPYITIQFPFH